MNTNHKGYAAGWKPFLGLLLAVCFLATAVHADSLFTGTFRLTNEVRWGNAVLTPGDYSIALDQSTHTLIVRNADTGKNVVRAIAAGAYYKAGNDDSELLIVHLGNRRAVSAVRLAGLGEVFQQEHPFPASKRAVEEAHNTEAIPVELAKK